MHQEQTVKAKEIDLKLVFADVLKGYTKIRSKHLGESDLYIKHLNLFDNIQTDRNYTDALALAKRKELPTGEEQKEYLLKENLWGEKQEKRLEELKNYIISLRATKGKLYLKSQIDSIKKEIEESEQELSALAGEKAELIGFTAEKYANKRSNEMYIQNAVYKDERFEELALDDDAFNHMSDQDLSELTNDYNEATLHVTLDNLKKISLLPFFCNYYYLCDDNPQIFYGKPVVDLTFFQAELFAFGRYFKTLSQDSKASPPDDIRNDPDKLIEFYEMRKNADEVMEKLDAKSGEKAGATSLVGATKEDLEAIGYKGANTVSLSEVAAIKGGELGMQDFIDLHS